MKPHNAESLTSCSVAMVRRHKVCCTVPHCYQLKAAVWKFWERRYNSEEETSKHSADM